MEKLLTIKEVAERIGVVPKTIYKWISKGKIVFIKLPGGDVRFKEEHLANWIENKTVKKKTA